MARQLTDQYPQWTQRIVERWDGICKILIFRHPTLAALLCNATPVAVIGKEGEFVLFIQVQYTPHLEQLATPTATQAVEEILQRLYDLVTIHIRFIGPESMPPDEVIPPLSSSPALSKNVDQAPLPHLLMPWEHVKRATKLKSPKAMAQPGQ